MKYRQRSHSLPNESLDLYYVLNAKNLSGNYDKNQLNVMLCALVSIFLLLATDSSYAQPSVPASQQTTEGMQTIASEANLPVVNFESDIVYANYDEMNVILHLITPQQGRNAEPVPLVIYVPGSAWFPKTWQDQFRA